MENLFVHLGNNISVFADDIIGVFDIERVSKCQSVRDFFSRERKKGKVYYCTLDMPKSFVITPETLFICGVSSEIIKKRFKNLKILNK